MYLKYFKLKINTIIDTRDSKWNVLKDGDSVVFTKTMNVKETQINLKKGTKTKNIRLTNSPEVIDAKFEGTSLVLKTIFKKKK